MRDRSVAHSRPLGGKPVSVRSHARRSLACVLILLCFIHAPVGAHDIPEEIILQSHVRPVNDQLELLVRVPLVMLLNLDLPKVGAGFIDLAHVDDALQRVLAATASELVVYEDGVPLAYSRARARISQPSDESFSTFEKALESVEGLPLSASAQVFWNQGYFDAHYTYPIDSDEADFALELLVAPGLKERLKLIVQYAGPEDVSRVYELHVGAGAVSLDPAWYRAAWTFVKLGFAHILDGIDHLLFLLCLVVPFRARDVRSLVAVVTSFTVAHSVTLLVAAAGHVPQGTWFAPLVELAIAASIVCLAIENVLGASLRYRWLIAGGFGLVHGFGFSFALQQSMQLAGAHLTLSLFAFNVGVELGQLAFLILCLPVLALALRGAKAERLGTIVISVLVGHTAWHWLAERWGMLGPILAVDQQARQIVTVLGVFVAIGVLAGVAWPVVRRRLALSPVRRGGKP